MIRLVGPGGAGKTSTGALVAERLRARFLDLDRYFANQFGDVGEYISRYGYDAYARENVAAYCSSVQQSGGAPVVALSSGFMTYPENIHPEYGNVRIAIERSATTFVLLPSLDLELCVAETVRRQLERPFGRSAAREEEVIRQRFCLYLSLQAQKVQTMRPVAEVADEIVANLTPDTLPQEWAGRDDLFIGSNGAASCSGRVRWADTP